MNPPRVLALVGDENGCTLWRVFLPFTHLQQQGLFAHFKSRDDPETYSRQFVDKLPANFDALVLPRLWWPKKSHAERFIGALHQAGLAVIYEVDDDIFSPAISDRQFALFPEGHDSVESIETERQGRIDALQLCDGVTVASKRLATVVRQYVDAPVEVVPNAIDGHWYRQMFKNIPRVVPGLTIGWFGGQRYAEDVQPLAEAWTIVADRYPDVNFVVFGQQLECLVNAVPAERLRKLAWAPLTEGPDTKPGWVYPRPLLNIDIACCSVAPRLFNTAKTPIKLWEATLAGAAVVASPTLYGPVSSDGEDVLLAESPAQWAHALGRLVEDDQLRRSLRKAQRQRIARDHDLSKNAWRWPAAWASILEQSPVRRRLAA